MYKLKHPIAAFRERVFHLSTAAGAALTGQTFSGTDLQIRKPGASTYSNCNSTQQSAVVEIGGGDYVYTFAQSELDTIGPGLAFKVGKSGAVSATYVDGIDLAYFATVQTGTLLPTAFPTDRAETVDNYWQDALITALTGALAGQVKKVGSYAGSGSIIMLATGLAFTGAPSAGDIFEILVR